MLQTPRAEQQTRRPPLLLAIDGLRQTDGLTDTRLLPLLDILRVLSDLLDAVDRGDTASLVLLDLTAAFDTVDHEILLKRLRVTFGVDSIALSWFSSYLAGRKQHVRCGGKRSSITDVICGVPQGSVLGPILFIIYTADLAPIVANTICRCTSTPTTARFTVPVRLLPPPVCRPSSLLQLTAYPAGCDLIVSSLMLRKLR